MFTKSGSRIKRLKIFPSKILFSNQFYQFFQITLFIFLFRYIHLCEVRVRERREEREGRKEKGKKREGKRGVRDLFCTNLLIKWAQWPSLVRLNPGARNLICPPAG